MDGGFHRHQRPQGPVEYHEPGRRQWEQHGFGYDPGEPESILLTANPAIAPFKGKALSDWIGRRLRLGLSVAKAHAMEQVLADVVLREALLSRGLQQTAKLTWQQCTRESSDVYRGVVKES